MNANYDDPKYTAYVLGELDDTERTMVEAELQADPQLAAAVAEIRTATERLARMLQTESLPQLRAGQRATLLAAAGNTVSNGQESLNTSASPSPTEKEERSKQHTVKVSTTIRPRRLSWRGRLIAVGTVAIAGCFMVALLSPAVYNARQLARSHNASNNLQQLGESTQNDIEQQQLPPDFLEALKSVEVKDTSLAFPDQKRWNELQKQRQIYESLSAGETRSDRSVNLGGQSNDQYKVAKPVHETKLRNPRTIPRQSPAKASNTPASIMPANSEVVGQSGPNELGQNSFGSALPSDELKLGVTPKIIIQEEEGEQLGGRSLSRKDRSAVKEQSAKQDQPGDGQQQNRPVNLQNQSQSQLQGQQQAGQSPNGRETLGFHQNRGPRDFLYRKDTASLNESVTPQRGIISGGRPNAETKPSVASQPQGGQDDAKDFSGEKPGPQTSVRLNFEDKLADSRNLRELEDLQEADELRRKWEFNGDHNTEAYDYVNDNPFLGSGENPLSTFSIDVDTASYSNIRRFLMQQNQRPPRGAVRIEELVNYFRYDYPQPEGNKPFSVTTEVASCPWEPQHRLVRIGLKGREIPKDKRPMTNLVFLIDVSGSMQPDNKLPLVKQSLKMLTEQLGENDKVSMVVYAGSSGLVLPSTRGDNRQVILDAIDHLDAGGSTNGAQGIELAYEIATNNLQKGGVNRVILATDGDFNVGVTNQDDLVRLIEEKAKTGVFLTTLGFGMGNIKDSTLEKLADKGNGNYAYIDDLPEARKVLVEQMGSTLVTIAKDVKIQVEFNPAEVASYRLIGYENRVMAKEDFNDDKKDAGEIGAGHTVTALYEVVPVGQAVETEQAAGGKQQAKEKKSESRESADVLANDQPAAVDALRYQQPASLSEAAKTGEFFTLKLRYKQPDGDKSTLIETPVKDTGKKYREASADFKFAAAVASFGMILRDSPFKGNATIAAVEELAGEGVLKKDDKQQTDASYRAEFVEMVKKAKQLGAP